LTLRVNEKSYHAHSLKQMYTGDVKARYRDEIEKFNPQNRDAPLFNLSRLKRNVSHPRRRRFRDLQNSKLLLSNSLMHPVPVAEIKVPYTQTQAY